MRRLGVFVIAVGVMMATGGQAAVAGEDWQFEEEADGVRVYSRSVADSDYRMFKATAMVDASMASVAAVLRDVPEYPQWVAKIRHAAILEKYSPNAMDVYLVMDFPWPVCDRDCAASAEMAIDPDAPGTVTTTKILQTPACAQKKGVVRLPDMFQQYIVTYKEIEKSELTMVLYLDAGGSLPASLVNAATKSVPAESVDNLREMVEMDKYEQADHFSPANIDITRAIVKHVLSDYVNDQSILDMVLDDKSLMLLTLEEHLPEGASPEITSAIIKKYVRTADFAEKIGQSPYRDELSKLIDNEDLVDELLEEDELMALILKNGALTDALMAKIALYIQRDLV